MIRTIRLLRAAALLLLACGGTVGASSAGAAPALRVGLFQIDASPPIGSPLAYDTCIEITDPLTCRGMVLLGAGRPIVIAAVDWLGIANEAHREFRQRLAAAADTDLSRVTVHTLHQHDAPRCDFTAASLLAHYGHRHPHYDVPWAREVIDRAATAVEQAIQSARPVDGFGYAMAEVHQVASNRRIQDESGQVVATRYTACRDPKLRALPAGTVDPMLRAVSFWQGDTPIVVLTYFATHPQSYYRTGQANPDFPGYARDQRQSDTGTPHIHLNGAGGNIGAGKWNDGSHDNRAVLTHRVADAMQRAFEATQRQPLPITAIDWRSVGIQLPVAAHLQETQLVDQLQRPDATPAQRRTAAKHLAWLRHVRAGEKIDVSCLSIGPVRILHLPGELFVEYQLAAQQMRPDLFVAMAAYGEYGPGYIGTQVAYGQGGYETSAGASRVAAQSEQVLLRAIASLLEADADATAASQIH